jgi:hypothetical protein
LKKVLTCGTKFCQKTEKFEEKMMPIRDEKTEKIETESVPKGGLMGKTAIDGGTFYVFAESNKFLLTVFLTEGFGPVKKRYCVLHRQHNCFREVYFLSYAGGKNFGLRDLRRKME